VNKRLMAVNHKLVHTHQSHDKLMIHTLLMTNYGDLQY